MTMLQTDLIWLKNVECPLCYEEFQVENVWQKKVTVLKEYQDLGKKYQGTNPLFYSVWTCPNCYYSDFRGDDYFNTGKIVDEDFEDDFEILEMVAQKADFLQPRNFNLAVASYKLAILCAKHKKSSMARLGTFNLRLGWLYRSLRKTDLEKKYIQYTLDYYLQAFTHEDNPDFGTLSQGGITYLLGELYRQTGDLRNAINFFQKVVNDKEMDTEPKYIRMARFGWESLKDTPSAAEAEPDPEPGEGEELPPSPVEGEKAS
ncbi:DUF2225 domain-containing protein [bacterium]|jgi:uncharacterized protein|nr:DUF2225 domain-containing protein [bacterium]